MIGNSAQATATAPTSGASAAWSEGAWAGRERLSFRVAFALVLCGAAAIRLYGLKFGLPFLYDFDEPTFSDRAYQIVASGDFNPHWFGHPGSLTIYSLAFAYWLFSLIGVAVGWFQSLDDAAREYWYEPSAFFFVGRLVIAAFGMLTVLLTYLVARRIADRWTALLAMAIVAVAPLSVEYSRLIRTDSQVTVLILATLWFAMAVAEQGRWRDYVLAGFFLGLGVATKYPAVTALSVIGLAWLMDTGLSPRAWVRHFPRLAAAGLASLAGAFLGAPFLFLDLGTAIQDVKAEGTGYHLGATSDGALSTLQWYIVDVLGRSLTIAGLLLAAVGMVVLLRSRRPQALLVAAFFITFLVFLSVLSLRWERWALPLLPLAAILAAVGFSTVVRRLLDVPALVSVRTVVVAVLVLAWLAPPVARSFSHARALAGGHTVSIAWRWVIDHVEPGATLLVERYTPQLPRERYVVLEADVKGGMAPLSDRGEAYLRPFSPLAWMRDIRQLHAAGVDYVLLGNDYDRRLAVGDRERDAVELYVYVMTCGELLYQVDPVPGRLAGTTVRVYRMPKSPCGAIAASP